MLSHHSLLVLADRTPPAIYLDIPQAQCDRATRMASQPPEHIAEELLQRAHPENAETIFRERVKQRPLLLRPSSPDPNLNARSKRQHDRLHKARAKQKSNKPKPLSAKQKRALCIYEIPKSQRKYAIYEPLHQMWCGYMREILGLKDGREYITAAAAGHIEESTYSRFARTASKYICLNSSKTPSHLLLPVLLNHSVLTDIIPFDPAGKLHARGGTSEGLTNTI